MTLRNLSPKDAAAALEANPDAVYVDVRSQREFAAGHPAGAINIPIAEVDPGTGQMAFNREFLAVSEKVLAKDREIYLGCQSGKRSEAAGQMLAEAGYSKATNVMGGFGGARDPLGCIVQPGWADSGLPVSNESGEGVSYESLKRKALG